MLVGIHSDPTRKYQKRYIQRLETILDYNRIDHVQLHANHSDFWQKVKQLDLFIFHWSGTVIEHQLAPTILPIVEKEIGVPCYPVITQRN